MDYLVLPVNAPIPMGEILHSRYAIHDFPSVVRRTPAAYLKQRACSVSYLIGFSGHPVYFLTGTWSTKTTFAFIRQAFCRMCGRLALSIEHRTVHSRILQFPFRHGLMMIYEPARRIGHDFHKDQSGKSFRRSVPVIAGLAILFPLLIVTPAADWRYLMPANICWASSVGIGVASFRFGARKTSPRTVGAWSTAPACHPRPAPISISKLA